MADCDGDALKASAIVARTARSQLASVKMRVDPDRGSVRVERVRSNETKPAPRDVPRLGSPSRYTDQDLRQVDAAHRDGEPIDGGLFAARGRIQAELYRPTAERARLQEDRSRAFWRTLEQLQVPEAEQVRIADDWRRAFPTGHRRGTDLDARAQVWPTIDETVELVQFRRRRSASQRSIALDEPDETDE